jgi:hypothetical protein
MVSGLRRLLPWVLAAVLAAPAACKKIDTAFDCQAACTKYRECFDAKYDVAHCRARCRSNASSDPGLQRKADACESCISGQACLPAIFDCGKQCLGVVP